MFFKQPWEKTYFRGPFVLFIADHPAAEADLIFRVLHVPNDPIDAHHDSRGNRELKGPLGLNGIQKMEYLTCRVVFHNG